MTTTLDATGRTDALDGPPAVTYRVRRLSLRGEIAESSFADETDARAHQQTLIAGSGDGLVIVERLVKVDGNGGLPHYEVTAIARDLC